MRGGKPMTEREWRSSTDPGAMLAFLQRSGKISERKLRLFGVACCRRIWHLLPDEPRRRGVEAAELFADGLVSEAEVEATVNAAVEGSRDYTHGIPQVVWWRAAEAVDQLLPPEDQELWWRLFLVWQNVAFAMEGEQLVKEGATPEMLEGWADQSVESEKIMGWTAIDPNAILADVLREIIGNRFRPAAIDAKWLTATVRSLAQQMYESRDFSTMPVLADALEEAGCTNADLLSHVRGPGPHVRGCWALDLIFGKS
jgi:hypothetical protein